MDDGIESFQRASRARLDGSVDFLDQRWCEYTGLGLDEALDRGWQTAVHPDDLPELLERWRSVLASRQPLCYA